MSTTKRTCSIDGCDGAHVARGWCSKHWQRWKRFGDPLGSAYGTLEERFWAKVDKNGPIPAHRPDLGPCWVWTASVFSMGYGQLGVGGCPMGAHRYSYAPHFGLPAPDPDNPPCVLHRCDNPPCVNPGHLFVGTKADNNADMDAKGRRRNGGAKLTAAQVRAIRVARGTHREIAERYGVCATNVGLIRAGKTWADTT